MQKQCTGLKNFVVRLTKVRCKGSKNLSEIQGRSLQGVQKHARDSVHIFAGAAKACQRFRLNFCWGCKSMPEIPFELLLGLQMK